MSKILLTRFVCEPRRHNSILLSNAKFTLVLIHDITFDLLIPRFIDISPPIFPVVANTRSM